MTDYRTVDLTGVIAQCFDVSKSQARRWIDDKAVKLDGEVYEWYTCAAMDIHGKVLNIGKKKWRRIHVSG